MAYVSAYQPDVLAISVTMPFNIEKVRDIINALKAAPELTGVKVMVGGKVLNEYPELWRLIGADGFAANPALAMQLAESWRVA